MNKAIYLLFAILLCSISTYGQKTEANYKMAKKYYEEASALRNKGKYLEALTVIEKSLNICYENQYWDEVFNASVMKGGIQMHLRRNDEAKAGMLSDLRRGDQFVPQKLRSRGKIHMYIARSYMNLRKLDSARYHIELSIKTLREADSTHSDLANSLSVGGMIALYSSESLQAVKYFEETIRLLEGKTDSYSRQILNSSYANLGTQYRVLGNYDLAEKYILRSIKMIEPMLGRPNLNLSAIYLTLSPVYGHMGRYDKAMETAKKALRIKKEFPNDSPRYPITMFLTSLADKYVNSNDTKNALKTCEDVLMEKDIDDYSLAEIYRIQGRVYSIDNQPQKALQILNKCMSILAPSGDISEVYIAGVSIDLGLAYMDLRQYDSALSYLNKATTFFEENVSESDNITDSYNYMGDFYTETKDFDKAVSYYDKAINAILIDDEQGIIEDNISGSSMLLLNSLGGKLTSLSQAGYSPDSEEIRKCELQINNLMKVIQVEYINTSDRLGLADRLSILYQSQANYYATVEGGENGFFNTLQATKSSNLLTAVQAYSLDTDEPSLIEALNSKKQTEVEIRYYQSKNDIKPESIWEEKIFTLKNSLDSLNSLIKTQYPNYHKLKYSTETISLERTQSSLEANQALIEYFVGDNSIYAFTITNDLAEIQQLEIQPSQLSKLVKTFRQSLNKPDADWKSYLKSGHELYQAVLQASIQKLPKGINHLIIVPDGELGYVPFESLLTQKAEGENYAAMPYLVRDYQISYAYSATLLFDGFQHERSPSNDGVLSFAPAYQNSKTDSIQLLALGKFRDQITSLVWNQKEANQITQFVTGKPFVGEFATERAFKQNAGDYNILHLAMHALVDDQNPMYSKLVFTQSEDSTEDNYLNAYELYNMKLNANLAVLSACNTGYGKLVRGEGIMSLARGFAYAGCPSVVMSHWQVDDEATAKLMEYFYEGLSSGMTKSEALRNAQLKYLNSAEPRQAHPFYWSSFVMIGEDTPIKSSSNFIYWAGLLFLGLGIALIMKMRGKK